MLHDNSLHSRMSQKFGVSKFYLEGVRRGDGVRLRKVPS